MTNLIIIGNGFDMAHDLKTSYSKFIEFLAISKFENESLYSNLFELDEMSKMKYENYAEFKDNQNQYIREKLFISDNLFFKRITNKLFEFNWCDIEREYFIELSNIGKDARYKTAKELNTDFEIVKKHLSDYLKSEQSNFGHVWAYEQFFEKMSFEKTMILNFNYTSSVSNYIRNDKSELVQIHGIIDSEENPIVFGYAADDEESRKLLQFEDKEFMRNIKKHNYKRTKEENRLIQFLDNNQDIEVSIIGHSCGISDKLILNQIFNNKNVSDIRIYYHKNYEHYFETQVNIDRIMNNDSNFRKLINFQDSIFIPQKNNQSELETFNNQFNLLYNKRKKIQEDRYRIY